MAAPTVARSTVQDRLYAAALPAVFVVSLGPTLGLTYAPCYSGLCVEALFPFEARVHIASFYGMLAAAALALMLRAYSAPVRRLSEAYVVRTPVPILDQRVTAGGVLLALWLVGLILATTGFWVQPQLEVYRERARTAGVQLAGTVSLAITAVIGHHADMAVGLLILPVARSSLLGRVFGVSQSTLLSAHKLLAYLALVAVLAHAVAYFVRAPTPF